MDPRLLRYYNRELQHVREMGGEFAQEFPKIAGRLGLEGFACADPYVERLLEGFAFLAARVQLKLDDEFPRFTQHLLEMVYPHYLSPVPSMAVVQLQPDPAQGSLASGFAVPRGSALRSLLGKGDQTPCEYRTAHEVTLWPVELAAAEYVHHPRGLPASGAPWLRSARAALRLTLRTTGGLAFDKLPLERLQLFLRGSGETPMRLYEALLAGGLGAVASSGGGAPQVLESSAPLPLGFGDECALLPFGPRSFQGYRLLREYFSFPERFLFVELAGLGPAVRRCSGSELELQVALARPDAALEGAIDASRLALFCTPAVNLFPKRADRIHVGEQATEFHVVPDRTRPLDFEVYGVTDVVGYATGPDQEQEFLPFYAVSGARGHAAYYTVRREPRLLSSRQRRYGPRSSYVGSELFLSVVDAGEAPYRTDLKQLAVGVLCTNRDLPLQMPLGQGRTDFTLESGAPVQAVRCVAGPTRPEPSVASGETAWRLVGHLALNYLSLADNDEKQGPVALRELLGLYIGPGGSTLRKQVEALRSVASRPINRRIPTPGPITFGRGLEVAVTFEEATFGGSGVYLLGAVLAEFFGRYVTLNSFTETVLRTVERGEIARWPAKMGQKPLL